MMGSTRTSTVEEGMYQTLRFMRDDQAREPNRHRALVITNLEQACLWNDAHRATLGLDPLGLDWRA